MSTCEDFVSTLPSMTFHGISSSGQSWAGFFPLIWSIHCPLIDLELANGHFRSTMPNCLCSLCFQSMGSVGSRMMSTSWLHLHIKSEQNTVLTLGRQLWLPWRCKERECSSTFGWRMRKQLVVRPPRRELFLSDGRFRLILSNCPLQDSSSCLTQRGQRKAPFERR